MLIFDEARDLKRPFVHLSVHLSEPAGQTSQFEIEIEFLLKRHLFSCIIFRI